LVWVTPLIRRDPQIVQKIEESLADPRNHRYSVSNGIGNLRKEVSARYMKRYGVRLDANDEVLAVLGSKEGFSHMCLAMMGPGDTAIVPRLFPIHVYSVMLASGNVIALDVRDPEKFLRNIAYTCEHLVPKPKLVVVNFPHNPSSTVVEQDFFVELVRLAKKHHFLVISDFAYADVCFDGYKAPSFLSTPGALDVGVELTSMSKSYSMAGWRIGFCCGNREMVHALSPLSRDTTTTASFSPSRLRPSSPCDTATMPSIKWRPNTKSAAMHSAMDFAASAGIPSSSKAGMFVWTEIPEPWRKMGFIEFAMKLLNEGGVAVSPGRGFGPEGEGYLRLAIVENSKRLRQAVRQIDKCLETESAASA
jgi:alanine-synthesizing transaminase